MIKVEAETLEVAYQNAASQLGCSVTALKIEVVQAPNKGFLGLFKKTAIIVAVKEVNEESSTESTHVQHKIKCDILKQKAIKEINVNTNNESDQSAKVNESEALKYEEKQTKRVDTKKETLNVEATHNKKTKHRHNNKQNSQKILNDTIMPTSFVSMQDDEEEYDVSSYLADYEEDEAEDIKSISEVAGVVRTEINELFNLTCFKIEAIDVCAYDANTLLVEFSGEDAALLIGKEGYRYKALSYMIFNWINTKYQVQLRLEIAEFLKNQEESICKYLVGICDTIEKEGRAQTKILDGVLVQIALNELRERYPDKYIVIRSTRDGLKYIIINDYHAN